MQTIIPQNFEQQDNQWNNFAPHITHEGKNCIENIPVKSNLISRCVDFESSLDQL